MYPEYPDIDEHIDWSGSRFGKPQFDRTSIRVPVQQLVVSKKYPEVTLHEKAILVFEGVVSSERAILEYLTPEGKEFKEKVVLSDGPFDDINEQAYSFYIGGISYDPHAWIEWEIVAVSVRVEVVR